MIRVKDIWCTECGYWYEDHPLEYIEEGFTICGQWIGGEGAKGRSCRGLVEVFWERNNEEILYGDLADFWEE